MIVFRAAGLGLVAALLACSRTLVEGVKEQALVTEPAISSAVLSEANANLLNVVLEDLLANPEFSTYPSWDNRPNVVVWNQSAGQSWFVSRDQVFPELRNAPDFPLSLLNDLAERNTRVVSLETFKPKNPKILVGPKIRVLGERRPPTPGTEGKDHFEKKYPDAKAYVAFWIPVTSDDQSTAIVRFKFGPTVHGACGTYLLRREGQAWKVIYRKLAYYA
jgi:hypothetical protein